MEKTVAKFRNFSDAEKADREFYRKLTGQERLDICLELSKQEPERPLRGFGESSNSRGPKYLIAERSQMARSEVRQNAPDRMRYSVL